jgi:protein ImuB
MLGHASVTRPVLAGGRRPSDQVTLVPFGDVAAPRRPAARPWPGQIPAPAPATVFAEPVAVRVTDAAGQLVSVSGRAQLPAAPAWLARDGESALAIVAWAGPWPVNERWWDPAQSCRQARFQLVTDDGSAWLVVLRAGHWLIEARYD